MSWKKKSAGLTVLFPASLSAPAEWRCFQGLAGRLIPGTETCQHVIICVILYLEQQVTATVVHGWSLNCQGESKASLDGPESP